MQRRKQVRVSGAFNWDLGDLCFSDQLPTGKNATVRANQRKRDQSKKTGRDTRQDFNTKYGEV